MKERLSSSTVRSYAIYLTLITLVAGWWAYALVSSPTTENRLAAGLWLVLLALYVYQCLTWEVTLTPTNLYLRRLFTRSVTYPLSAFIALEPTNWPYRPMRLRLADGRSFLFAPKLKAHLLSVESHDPADFVMYWMEEIIQRATHAQPTSWLEVITTGKWL